MKTLDRRQFLKASGSGLLVVSFPFSELAQAATHTGLTPAKSVAKDALDTWLSIDRQNQVTVYVGKVDLGTGTKTALAQIAAEELSVPFNHIHMVMGDTGTTPAGLKKGDQIILIDTNSIEYFDQIQTGLYFKKGKMVDVSVLRAKDTLRLKAQVKSDGTIGFMPKSQGYIDSMAIHKKQFGLMESISVGISSGYNTIVDYVAQFKYVFTKKGAGQMGGFAAIGNMFPPLWNWQQFWLTTAFLSIVLAFMNILPIPALDGGHVVFLIYEMITGKEPHKKVLEYAQYIGMILLFSLIIYANFNDLYRWLFPN